MQTRRALVVLGKPSAFRRGTDFFRLLPLPCAFGIDVWETIKILYGYYQKVVLLLMALLCYIAGKL